MALGGIDVSELATLPKIELRVDTSSHNLQVTGEILASLEYLKLNDSIIRSFRDIGTSFKNVRVLHIARCEIKEVQGIQAFEQLEELYISFNEIDDLFDISFLEHLQVLDFEGNNVQEMSQLMYLRRCRNLMNANFKHNPVSSGQNAALYYEKMIELPRLAILDDEVIPANRQDFLESKQKQSKQAWQ
jgi:Leucine-rich repeat (LRR) protein